ncbi:glycerophosphoryl diester phosphodiesterase [Rhizocola hellebori]|uniref:Glycerophosphoryl diester phosphodiesterase n=1 Tax=Rhizocola hellebori TaxID=1392758 RepID=A0A8J3VFQ4_9ACTN|nr:glycerophosphodiester phosphodiesterase [Rhizocola hellebori]GIH04108.1 glycerophosphoryl diester phosphodiesterase [Rhizocola hellebori]
MIFPYLESPPLAFAHRGGAAEGDENTAEAFARSVQFGYRYVETDVHATRDGVPVVLHDATLDRVTGAHRTPVASLSYAELADFRVAASSAIPRLDEVLDAWPQIKFNIDVKSDAAVQPTVEAVLRAGAGDRVLLASFSDSRLRRMRALTRGAVATSLAQREAARVWLASRVGLRLKLPPNIVAAQIPRSIARRRFIDYAHRLGLQVHVWTVDDPGEMAGLLDLGVDGIMTDRIEVLREVFIQRGLWKESQ